jgi:hypothetical protein
MKVNIPETKNEASKTEKPPCRIGNEGFLTIHPTALLTSIDGTQTDKVEEPEKKETETPKCCNCKCQNQTTDLETKEIEITEIGAQETKTEEKEELKKEEIKTEETEESSQEKEKKYFLPYAMDNLGPTILRILGYMPNGEGDEDFFIKPSRDDLAYDTRSKEEDLHVYNSDNHQTKLEELQEITKENNFYVDGVKYVRLYDIIEEYLGVMPIPP